MVASKFCTRLVLLGMAVSLAGSSCYGQIDNGSFENTPPTDWTFVGAGSLNNFSGTVDGILPTDGNYYAYLNTGPGALAVGVQDSIFASQGLPSAYINSNFTNAIEGTIMFQNFTLGSGQNEICFDWNFLTNEATPPAGSNDFAFALLWSQTAGSLVATAYYDTFSPLPLTGSQFLRQSGWNTVIWSGLTPGHDYTIGFGVFDRNNSAVTSALLVDNVKAVPEPSSLIALIGLGIASAARRRKRS